jgi:NSS family neurotransmitter:Na+ symporter
MGQDPSEGAALVFVVLPNVFDAMPLGTLIGAVFFILLSIAALTSTVSLLEVVVSYFVDETTWSRKQSVWLVGGFTFLVGLPSALSQGGSDLLTNQISLFGQTGFLNIMDYIWGNLALALGALLLSIFVAWVWGTRQAVEELQVGADGMFSGTLVSVWTFFLKFVCPLVIAIIFGAIALGVI